MQSLKEKRNKEIKEEVIITPEIIEEQLTRVNDGKALTVSLAIPNGEFKDIYKKKYGDSLQMLRKDPHRSYKKICTCCFNGFKTTDKKRKYCSRVCYDLACRNYYRKKFNRSPERWRVK